MWKPALMETLLTAIITTSSCNNLPECKAWFEAGTRFVESKTVIEGNENDEINELRARILLKEEKEKLMIFFKKIRQNIFTSLFDGLAKDLSKGSTIPVLRLLAEVTLAFGFFFRKIVFTVTVFVR